MPQSSSNTIKSGERLVVTIERDQRLYLEDDQISVGQLERRLREAKAKNADVSVYLRADQDVPYGTVVRVMDGVKRSGIERLGMVTDPMAEERVRPSSTKARPRKTAGPEPS